MADAIPAQVTPKAPQAKTPEQKTPDQKTNQPAVATAPVTGPYKWRSDGKGNLTKVPI